MTTLVETALVVAVLAILPFVVMGLLIIEAVEDARFGRSDGSGASLARHGARRRRHAMDSGLA